MNKRSPLTLGPDSPVYMRRFREFKALVAEWTETMDGALKTYRNSLKLPHPPRPLSFLTEGKQIQLMVWRCYFVRYGFPLQDLLVTGLGHLVPQELQLRLLQRHGDLLGVGVPFKVFVSERPLEYLEAKLRPVSMDSRRLAVSGREKFRVPDIYGRQVTPAQLKAMKAQAGNAHVLANDLSRNRIPIDVFVQ